MAEVKLTDQIVVALACPPGRKDVMFFDAKVKGFGVRVTAKGVRVFLYQYRSGAKVCRLRLGAWPALTAPKARRLAETHRGAVYVGGDPVGEKRERPASTITSREAVAALDVVEAQRGTISARRSMAYARACYGWALKRHMLELNPFQGIAAPGKENPRDRVLAAEDVGAIWRASDQLGPFHRPFLRLLLLTLQRREEVAGMRWSEISADGLTWTVPAGRAKNGRAHLVHLAPAARELLEAIPRMGDSDLVFPGRGDRPISSFSNIKRALDVAIRTEREGQGLKPVELPDWRFHDFRRTGVTTLAGLGFAPHVCDRLLNHVTGAIQGVAAVYQRAEFLAERKVALEAWAAQIEVAPA